MPGKSRHSQGKHSQLSKKGKDRQRFLAATQPPVAAQVSSPAHPAEKAVPRANVPMPSAPVVASHPYVGAELLRIGILTTVILAILFALALISPRF